MDIIWTFNYTDFLFLLEELKEIFSGGKLGWTNFILRSNLLKSDNGFLHDHKLTICCEVKYI